MTAITPGPRFGFVGREAELTELAGLLADVDGSVVTLVEVTGAAGIGKSALLEEFVDRSRLAGRTALVGRLPFGESRPLDLLLDALDSDPRTALGPEPVAFDRDDPDPRAAADLVRSRLARTAPGPTLLVLDEVHLAGPESLLTLVDLLRMPVPVPVMLVLGYRARSADADVRRMLEAVSWQMADVQLDLRPLDRSEVDLMLGARGSSLWRDRILRESGGNPSYVETLVAERAPTAAERDPSTTFHALRAEHYLFFEAELRRLGPAARAVAVAAAVVGEEFDVGFVSRLVGAPESDVLDILAELVRRDLVRPRSSGYYFAFRHPVVRRAVYSASERGERVGLHANVEALLVEREAGAVERAPHVEQRARHGDVDAVEVLAVAAREVMLTRPSAAAAWLTTALRLLPEEPSQVRRARLLMELARARGVAGHLRECRNTMHEALHLLPSDPPDDRVEAVAFTAQVQRLLGEHVDTDAMLRVELDAIDDDVPARAALAFEVAAGHLKAGDAETSREWARRALRLCERHGDRGREAACHGLLAKALCVDGYVSAATEHGERALALLDGMLDSEFEAGLDAVEWVAWSFVLLERWDVALRLFGKGVDFASRSDRRILLPQLLAGKVYLLRNQGRVEDGLIVANHAVDLAEQSGSPEQIVGAYSIRSWTELLAGRLDDAVRSGRIATQINRAAVNGWRDGLAMRIVAEVRELMGDHGGCLALVQPLGGPQLDHLGLFTKVAWYALLNRAALASGQIELARTFVEACEETATRLGQIGRLGLALVARAELQLAEESSESLATARAALDHLDRSGMVVETLQARFVVARALEQAGRMVEAAREREGIHRACQRLGTLGLIVDGGPTGPDRTLDAVPVPAAGPLTDRESQIAELIRRGLTNRLIGRELIIAEKTVEMHVSRIFVKLGVENRAGVAAAVSRGACGGAGPVAPSILSAQNG